uniref:Proteasome activator PA28 C-terminal domain-containing protein n=1 Tax=Acrobeloides nanus TaxID=290746 RepID=A0A914DR23_9BILA
MPENIQPNTKSILYGPKESRVIEKVDNHFSVNQPIFFHEQVYPAPIKYPNNIEGHETFASCAKKSLKEAEKLIERLPELYLEWDKLKTEYSSKVHLTTSKDIVRNKRYDLIVGSLICMSVSAIAFLLTSNILYIIGFLAALGYLFIEELGFGKDNFTLKPNPEVEILIQKLQPKIDDLYEVLCHLYTWIRLHIPERSSGNNLFVEHQEDIGHQIHKCILYVANLNFELNSFPYKEVYKLAKDFWRNKQDYDLYEINSIEKKFFRDRYSQIFNCRDIIHETYDVLKKNFEKIKNPRGENETPSDDDEPKQKNCPSYIS